MPSESICVVCGFRYGCSRFAQHDTKIPRLGRGGAKRRGGLVLPLNGGVPTPFLLRAGFRPRGRGTACGGGGYPPLRLRRTPPRGRT